MKSKLCKSDIRENALRHEFVEILSKFPVREVKFSGNNASLSFLGHRISGHAVTKREEHVADWSRKRKEVFIDKKINIQDRRKSFKALCVHELIEKFLVEKFGLKIDTEAHVVAAKKEKEYLKVLEATGEATSS